MAPSPIRTGTAHPTGRGTALTLFACMFASQASLLVLTPILPAISADLGVSTSTTAQLRSVSGVVAGVVALYVALRSRPRPLRDPLLGGVGLLAAGCAVSALAPTFAVLVAAQVLIGVGLGAALSAALAAAGEWAPERAASTLAWALAGQPVAWIVGMPLAGAVAEVSWRLTWLVVPFAASVVALVAVLVRPRGAVPSSRTDEPPSWREPGVKGWAVGELLAYGAWAGTLVFMGALLVDSYATSTTLVGLLLALGAAAYVPGNFLARRVVDHHSRLLLLAGAAVSSVLVATLGLQRPTVAFTAVVFCVQAFVAGARTLAGSRYGLALAPTCRLQMMGFRTAAVQYGYLLGSAVGGGALAVGGYRGLGIALAVLYVAATVPHLPAVAALRRTPATATRSG